MMTTLNLVMNIGAALIPGVGQAIDGTLSMPHLSLNYLGSTC